MLALDGHAAGSRIPLGITPPATGNLSAIGNACVNSPVSWLNFAIL
jgi:hypothetical protein